MDKEVCKGVSAVLGRSTAYIVELRQAKMWQLASSFGLLMPAVFYCKPALVSEQGSMDTRCLASTIGHALLI
jgi:hypothetical protein